MCSTSTFTSREQQLLRRFFKSSPIRPEDDFRLSNQVARICLASVQERLPQWFSITESGTVVRGRESIPTMNRKVSGLSRQLFTLNWADSGPGYSWPEDYSVTYLPTFERFVVTAAQDSPDAWGVTELAIGHFSAEEAIREGSRKVITDWWRTLLKDCDQPRWEYLFNEGLIDEQTADEWADQVWSVNEEAFVHGD